MKYESTSPVGAVWMSAWTGRKENAYLWGLRKKIEKIFEKSGIKVKSEELDEAFGTNHTLAIKIQRVSQGHLEAFGKETYTLKPKYIAVPNKKKHTRTQPDYFLHIFQEYTGADKVYPSRTDPSVLEGEINAPTGTIQGHGPQVDHGV